MRVWCECVSGEERVINVGMTLRGIYRIARNFRGVQIFAFFEDAHFSAKLKHRHSCYLEDRRTGIDRTQCSACMQLTANN